jgi:2-hydroxy-6-oxonona-2,4-dienedioate hydrolase
MPGPVKLLFHVCFVFVLIFFTPYLSNLSAQDLAKPFSNSHFIIVDSVKFHYRIWNDTLQKTKGKVALIHGFMGSTFSWRENFDTLEKSGYKIIAVDLPGFGYSDRSLKVNQSQSNRARLLWDLLEELDKGDTARWNLIGHSMGGGTAEAMALMRPERTRTLTIVDGMVFSKNENMQGAFVTFSKNKQYNKVFSALVEKNMFTYNMIERLFRKNYGYIPDSSIVIGYLTPLLIHGSAESVMSVFSNSREITSLDVRQLEKLPVLVIWGKKDRTINLSRGKRFVRNVPSSELKIIPEEKHDPMETNPKEFNKHLIIFLNMNNNFK